jgi:hypothetical protein
MLRKCGGCRQLVPKQAFPPEARPEQFRRNRCWACHSSPGGIQSKPGALTTLGIILCSFASHRGGETRVLASAVSLLRYASTLPLCALPGWAFGGILLGLWDGCYCSRVCGLCEKCARISICLGSFLSIGCIDCWAEWLMYLEYTNPHTIGSFLRVTQPYVLSLRAISVVYAMDSGVQAQGCPEVAPIAEYGNAVGESTDQGSGRHREMV